MTKDGRKITAISVLGTRKDAEGGSSDERWRKWRPTIGFVRQESLPIDELHLIFSGSQRRLAEQVKKDIAAVSPQTKVEDEVIELADPWDFEEVYTEFYNLSLKPCFHEETTDYFIHMSTGSHVEQICLFLLAESRHFPAKLVQTSPSEGHVRESTDSKGKCAIIDLDLSRYDKLAKRFETRRQSGLSFLKQGIDTRNAAFNRLIETIERVAARSSEPILLTGPTGAGKSQLARQIYLLKKKNGLVKGAFVPVNCATLCGDLAKSALFGHKRGAFSGAGADHPGFLKEADGGILFLDEIACLPYETQAMLLKAIEEKTYRPLGAAKDESSTFQLICGTNRNLAALAPGVPLGAGQIPVPGLVQPFRADLLARIDLWSFRLPGLAERREDIEPNLDYELERFAAKTGRHVSMNREAREMFLRYAFDPENLWPGNFRELNAMVVRMATLADNGRITEETVAEEIERRREQLKYASATGRPSSNANVPNAICANANCGDAGAADEIELAGIDAGAIDPFDLVQLKHVITVCRRSQSAAAAARKLFSVSLKSRTSSNDSDRLVKYLRRFGLKFKDLQKR